MTLPVDFVNLLHQAPLYLLQARHAPAETSLIDTLLKSNVFNFLLVFGGLAFLVKKKNLFAGVDVQREKIASEIEAMEGQKRQALAQLEEAKRRTANLKSEVEEILKNAREQAEALSTQIIADARVESAKIVDNAKKRVELEQRSAIKELERRLLSDSLADARAELTRSLTAKEQTRSVEAFLDELAQTKGGRR